MNNSTGETNRLLLRGLDGSNPLAFLTAIGTLRALSEAWPDGQPKMTWREYSGAWRPALHFSSPGDRTKEVISALSTFVPYRALVPDPRIVRHRLRAARGLKALDRMQRQWSRQKISKESKKQKKEFVQKLITISQTEWLKEAHPYLLIGKNTSLPSSEYRKHLSEIASATKKERLLHDQFAALGSDLSADDGTMLDTALRTMSGSGHQHQLEFMANLLEQLTPDAIHRALFEPWEYTDPVRSLTLRIDPMDDSRYALQWGNPSTDSTRDDIGSVLGANALAVIGFSLISTVPVRRGLATIGFSGTGSRDTFWTWPVWRQPIGVDVVRSVLAHPQLQFKPLDNDALRALGIAVVFRSQRISVDKFRNFTPGHALMT